MSKNQLPMAINPSVNYNNNFQLIEIPNLGQHPFLDHFVIEVNTQTIGEGIAVFLGIGYDECIGYIGENNFTHCQFPRNGFHGHHMRYKGITLNQLRGLFDIAKQKKDTKFIPILSELILTQVLPLFNQPQHQTQPQINSDFSQEITLNPVNANQPLTMSSLEIAVMCNKEHRNVMADIKTMFEQLDISSADFSAVYKASNGKMNPCFNLDKEMSLTLVTGYSVVLRHKIIKRWQELENQLTGGVPQISAQPVTPAPAPIHGLPSAKDLAMMVIKSEEEKESLLIDYNFLSKELCQTIREKAQISSKREASALGKLARANDKIRQLEAQGVLNLDGEKLSLLEIANKLNVAPQALAHVISSLGIFGITSFCESQVTGHRNGKLDYDWVYTPLAVALIKQTLEKGK